MPKLIIKRGPTGRHIVFGGASIETIDWNKGALGPDGRRLWLFARYSLTFCVKGDGCYAGSGDTLLQAMTMAKAQRAFRRAERFAGVD